LWHPDPWGPLGRLLVEDGDRSRGVGTRTGNVEENPENKTKGDD